MFVLPGVSVRIVMGFERSGSVHSRKSYPLNIERESLIAKSDFIDCLPRRRSEPDWHSA